MISLKRHKKENTLKIGKLTSHSSSFGYGKNVLSYLLFVNLKRKFIFMFPVKGYSIIINSNAIMSPKKWTTHLSWFLFLQKTRILKDLSVHYIKRDIKTN